MIQTQARSLSSEPYITSVEQSVQRTDDIANGFLLCVIRGHAMFNLRILYV